MTPNPNPAPSTTTTLSRRTSLIDFFANLPIRPRLSSIRSRKSTRSTTSSIASSYMPSFTKKQQQHQQTAAAAGPAILKDADATAKLLECILDMPGGRRSLSRLARTCKALKEPALNVLWRDLDSLNPLLSLFPSNLLKRSRRPGLGLAKNPEPADWEKMLAYGERVRSVAYVEASNNVAPTFFPVIAELCPKTFLLPNLTALTWKAETPAGLDRCLTFLNPGLQNLVVEMGTKSARMNDFLNEVVLKTQLRAFSFTLHSNLPDNFVKLMQPNAALEKLALMAPGALAPQVGKWAASLPQLRSFQLDLSNRTTTAVEGFFDHISPGSGYSTPSSVGNGTDSGVFSGDELDFSEIRKSVGRLTSDAPRHGAFAHLAQIHLTGDTANVATFLKHVTSPLAHIELAIDDPPTREDWQDVCALVCEQFGGTLRSLRIGPSAASRFAELMRSSSASRSGGGGEVQLRHLTLEHLTYLPRLQRLEIDLPESAVFHNVDVAHLARVAPNVEVLRLGSAARFPASFGPPFMTLEGLVPLTTRCKRLHTLGVVVNALDARDETFLTHAPSSHALLRLHVGHSWVRDPLQTALLLSHLAPHLETLKWFSQGTARAGSGGAEAQHAGAWQKVSEFLLPLQTMRMTERRLLPAMPEVVPPPVMVDREVDATVRTAERGVSAAPEYVECAVEAVPERESVSVDATPAYVDAEVHVVPDRVEHAVDAVPETEDTGIDAIPSEEETHAEYNGEKTTHMYVPPILAAMLPSVNELSTIQSRVVRVYTYYLTMPLRYMLSFTSNMPSLTSGLFYAYDTTLKSTTLPGKFAAEEEEGYGGAGGEVVYEKQGTAYPRIMNSSSTVAENVLTDMHPVCQ